MRAVRSLRVRLAGARPVGENCCNSSCVMSSMGPDETPSNEERLNDKCGKSVQTCCAISGVDIINLEPETLRQ